MRPIAAVAGLLVWLAAVVVSAETGRYPTGVEGVKVGTIPPPGVYVRQYFLYYNSEELTDQHGEEIDLDFDASLFAAATRFIWITPQKVLGGDLGMDASIVWLANAEFGIEEFGIDRSNTRFSDIYMKPAFIAWHWDRFDLAVGQALWLPTGDDNPSNAALPNRDHWTFDELIAGTWYPDAEKQWAVSAFLGYEFHTENPETEIQPGQGLHLEWSVSRTVTPGLDLAVTGGVSWQTTDDSGDGVTYDPGIHDHVFSVGPEVSWFIPSAMLNIQARHLFEFDAEDRAEGQASVLCVTKIF